MNGHESNRYSEQILKGGRTTSGVVRIGNTVRRPKQKNSLFVRHLLSFLEAKGFEGSPRSLGTDDEGREVFSFLEGEVPDDIGFFDDAAITAAAQLIRRYHDAVADFADATAETICHNDLSPCNFVFRQGVPVAMIDFDAAAPGTREYDLGYAAWLWLNIGSSELSGSDQKQRLQAFVRAYGTLHISEVVRAMMVRQDALADEARRNGSEEMSKWAESCLHWTRENLCQSDP